MTTGSRTAPSVAASTSTASSVASGSSCFCSAAVPPTRIAQPANGRYAASACSDAGKGTSRGAGTAGNVKVAGAPGVLNGVELALTGSPPHCSAGSGAAAVLSAGGGSAAASSSRARFVAETAINIAVHVTVLRRTPTAIIDAAPWPRCQVV